jgi:hypothetical protein
MKKLTFSILFSILFCTIAWAQSTWELKNKADSLAQEQEYSLAIEKYQQIIENDKFEVVLYSEIYLNLAKSWLLEGEINLAISALDSAFMYGYDNLIKIENDEGLDVLRASPEFQKIIDREREFYNVEVIDNEWLLKALSIKKVVKLDDSKWDWVFDLNEFTGQENYENIPKEYDLKFTEDSLYDFSGKSLLIRNTKSESIKISNLKLKVLSFKSNLSDKCPNIFSCMSFMEINNINVEFLEIDFINSTIVSIEHVNTDLLDISSGAIFLFINYVDTREFSNLSLGYNEEWSEELRISDSQFGSPEIYSPIYILLEIDRVFISNSTFYQPISFSGSNVGLVEIYNNKFRDKVSIYRTNFASIENYIPFNQFAEGFTVEFSSSFYIYNDEGNYIKQNYDKLQDLNKRMHSVYREKGDIESANAIYIKLKELMADYTLQQYKETGNIEYLIKYQIEKLLKFYTKSGTSPERAILISIYILFGFSIIYLFFPSEWDNQRNKQVIQDYKTLIEKNGAGYLKPFIALSSNAFIVWLNAFSLSLNAFVTLGFGSIPIKGVGKYICIVQGFMGWFLLSIFTVTLINQVLI